MDPQAPQSNNNYTDLPSYLNTQQQVGQNPSVPSVNVPPSFSQPPSQHKSSGGKWLLVLVFLLLVTGATGASVFYVSKSSKGYIAPTTMPIIQKYKKRVPTPTPSITPTPTIDVKEENPDAVNINNETQDLEGVQNDIDKL